MAPGVAPRGLPDLQVLVFGHDGDLVAVDAEDFALQVDQLALAHLHVVAGLEVVLSFLPWGDGGDSEGTAPRRGVLARERRWHLLTRALCHHLQVDAFGLVLKLLQL